MLSYKNVSILDDQSIYYTSGLIGSSELNHLYVSKQYCQTRLKYPKVSKAMNEGRAIHSFILTPEQFKKEFAVCDLPRFDMRIKAYQDFVEKHKDKTIIKESFYQSLIALKNSLLSHDKFKKAFDRREFTEVGLVGELIFTSDYFDKPQIMRVRSRPDFVVRDVENKKVYIVDIKTCCDDGKICANLWRREIKARNYDIQAWHYLNMFKAFDESMGMDTSEWQYEVSHVAIAKEEPFDFDIFYFGDESLAYGEQKVVRAVENYFEIPVSKEV